MGLAVGLSIGGVVLLGLLVAVYRHLRRRQPQLASGIDFLRKPKSPEIALPTPWNVFRQPPVVTPRSRGASIFSYASVYESAETNEGPMSTVWGSSSATRGSWQGDICPLPKYAAHPGEDNVVQSPPSTGETVYESMSVCDTTCQWHHQRRKSTRS